MLRLMTFFCIKRDFFFLIMESSVYNVKHKLNAFKMMHVFITLCMPMSNLGIILEEDILLFVSSVCTLKYDKKQLWPLKRLLWYFNFLSWFVGGKENL